MSHATVRPDDVRHALARIRAAIARRVEKHGTDAYASRHEALGVLVEEYQEALEAIRADGAPERFLAEVIDLAVVAAWWTASARARDRAKRHRRST